LGAQPAPHTVHFSIRFSWSGITERFAWSRSFWSITGSVGTGRMGAAGFRFIN
jgi:hypothetical protein